jgi:hypothetical protein
MSQIITIFILILATIATADSYLLTSDYLVSLMQGAKLNQYIEGSFECAYLLRDS